mgnify:CR=1 FL=1
MVKSIYSIIIAVAILLFAGIGEQIYLKNVFAEIHEDFVMAYQKIENGDASSDDVNAIKTKWIAKKNVLHLFISHNDIKEMDLWLSEAVAYLKLGKIDESISKMEVAINLCEQIPKHYLIRLENIL